MSSIIFTEFDAAGRFTKLHAIPIESAEICKPTNSVEGTFSAGQHYFDTESGVVIQLPPQPSPVHTFDYTTKQWIDPRTLDEIKTKQWEIIKAARTQAEYSGFTWDGSAFDSDAISQARLTGAVQLAQLNPAMTLDWTLASNTVRTLSAADLTAVGVALGVHVATQFAKGQALRAQIDAATTKEAVEAIVW